MPKNFVQEREYDLVYFYLRDIRRHGLLTKQDESRLAQASEAGRQARTELDTEANISPSRVRALRRLVRSGDEAVEMFVNSNLRLVVAIDKKYQNSSLPLLDLIQDGNLGLINAVEKFDWRKGFRFSTYATWWIRQSISKGIANGSRTIRLPVHAGELLKQISGARTRLEAQLGRPPAASELAKDLDSSLDHIHQVLRYSVAPLSLSEPLRHESEGVLGDLVEDTRAISPSEAAVAAALPGEVERMLASINERERDILRMRFGLDRERPLTLEEVGIRYGLTRERIRQIESRALSKLRHPSSV